MKKSLLLSAALALVVLPMPMMPAHAQTQTGGVDAPKANTRAAKRAQAAKEGGTKATPMFPKATRTEPKQAGAPAVSKQLSALFELQEKPDSDDQAIAQADAILADPKANAFDKSSAAFIAGNAWQAKESSDYSNSVKYFKLALEDNGLGNNTHFVTMMLVAQLLDADEKHAEALTYIDRYLTETQSEDPKAYNVKTKILLGMGKPDEAAAVLEKLLATKPNDKQLMLNLASVYQEAGKDDKAVAVFERMRAAGLLTESKDYEVAWRLLANIEGREKDAMALIDEGMQKGILAPSYEIYSFQGRYYYDADQLPKAIEAWNKGAPMSKDGEMYLNVGKLQVGEQHWAEAKVAAKAALDKGIKKPGEAWRIIGESEAGLGNKAGAQAAQREAAKHPETKAWAEAALRQTSGK